MVFCILVEEALVLGGPLNCMGRNSWTISAQDVGGALQPKKDNN